MIKHNNPYSSTSRGFTLPELLVAMFIFTIIIAAIYNVFDLHNRMAARQEETTSMQQELLAAMSQMTYDLRMCGFSTSNDPRVAFTRATNTEIQCWIGGREIAYQINDNTLRYHHDMTEGGGYQPAAENIGDLQFSYFTENGTQIANPNANLAAIRSIEISATATSSPRRAGLQIGNRTMSTRVHVRNVR